MKKISSLPLAALCALILFGCASEPRLPSEDLEVPQFYQDEIVILKTPGLSPNSKEKYEAAKRLVEKVDFTMTRETKTLDELLFHGDAIIEETGDKARTIAFNYQYGNHYVRLVFYTFDRFVFRVEEVIK